MKRLLKILICLICCSAFEAQAKRPVYCQIIDQINSKFNKEIAKDYGFYCLGGGGAFMNDVKKVALDYKCYEARSIDEARQILLDLHDRYSKLINSHEKIRPYLHEFPFKEMNFALSCFDSHDGLYQDPPSICLAAINRNRIVYYESKRLANGEKDFTMETKEVLRETIEEARRRVK